MISIWNLIFFLFLVFVKVLCQGKKTITLGDFFSTMIGRTNIEGSKINVDMNTWQPQKSVMSVGRGNHLGLGWVLDVLILLTFTFICICAIIQPPSQSILSPRPCSQWYLLMAAREALLNYIQNSQWKDSGVEDFCLCYT